MRALTDRDYVALTLYGEARGESLRGLAAVANVIRNRRRSGRWGSTYQDVCLAPKQFSCWFAAGGADNFADVQRVRQILIDQQGTPPFALGRCFEMADAILDTANSWLRDNVSGATHYLVTTLQPWPTWARNELPVVVLGKHSFFANIA